MFKKLTEKVKEYGYNFNHVRRPGCCFRNVQQKQVDMDSESTFDTRD